MAFILCHTAKPCRQPCGLRHRIHHPGDTVSVNGLRELIRGAEAQTRVRPRRRTELVRERISAQAQQMRRPQRLLVQQRAKQAHQQQTHTRLREQIFRAAQAQKMPISAGESSRWAQRCQRWQARLARLDKQLATAERVIARHQAYLQQLSQALAQLQNWLQTLGADNRTNPDPPLCEARMDSGFSSGSNLTWLIEMGYQVNTKAVGGLTTAALRQTMAADASWTRVGDNAERLVCPQSSVHDCPYTLRLALERFKVRDAYQYATLLQFRDDGQACTLLDWFQAYNARQTIEAGNKESKSGVFHVQYLMSRSPAGIRLQVMFATLAANVMQWCRPWLRKGATQPTAKLLQTFNSPKHMVRVAANCAARVQQTTSGTSLQFAPTSALPGAILVLKGVPAFQPPLNLSFVVQNCN